MKTKNDSLELCRFFHAQLLAAAAELTKHENGQLAAADTWQDNTDFYRYDAEKIKLRSQVAYWQSRFFGRSVQDCLIVGAIRSPEEQHKAQISFEIKSAVETGVHSYDDPFTGEQVQLTTEQIEQTKRDLRSRRNGVK